MKSSRSVGTALFCIALTVAHASPVAAQDAGSVFLLPEGQSFTNAGRQLVSITADGTRMVYVASTRLYVSRVGSGAATEIPGTLTPQGLTNPVFSPDGRSVAYWSAADQTFKRIPVDGGTPVTLFRGINPFGMTWTDDDRIVAAQGAAGILSGPRAADRRRPS